MNNINFDSTKQEDNFPSKEESLEFLSAQRMQELKQNYLPRPLPLQREIALPKPFPFEALGSVLGPVAKRIHEVTQAPDSICGQSVLASAALIVQPYADIYIDGRTYPLSLFMLTVAESGDRKSAVDKIVLQPIRDYEKMLAKSHTHDKLIYKNKQDAWKKQRDLILRGELTPDTLEAELNKIASEPKRPLDPYILLVDPTYEGLVKLFDTGQPSMGLFADEGGQMLGGYAMGKDNLLKTACGLSSLWDGKSISRIRGGDQNLLLHGKRFSSHLMIQEVVFANLLKDEILVGQGLLARHLIVAPASNAGKRPYNSTDISQDPLIRGYYTHASSLLDQPFPLANPDIQNELSPRPLELSPSAKETWIRFHDEIDQALKRDGSLYGIRRTANKAAEQVLRIAGVLTLIENFEAATISLDVIERAIELTRFYLDEALRIADMGYLDPTLELAQAVLEWMRKKVAVEDARKTFSLQEIYQKAGPRGVRNKYMAQKVMRILEEHECIQRVNTEKLEWRLNYSPTVVN